MALKGTYRKVWNFVWNDDSIWSWLVNIGLAFIIIKFILYPALGFALGTSYPIVAVVSGSMEHEGHFDDWWDKAKVSYLDFNITSFEKFPLKNGFSKGDLIVLRKAEPESLKVGDVIVFRTFRPDPVIHRIVLVKQVNGDIGFQTKGDNYRKNFNSLPEEKNISRDSILGRAWFKIPYLGWVKILFVDIVNFLQERLS
ncbi:signal peptidase I [Candidatus Woesearchaeota archaeon]|nr:signal peptidase I [Candidatus Woesearchaeota archaeon]